VRKVSVFTNALRQQLREGGTPNPFKRSNKSAKCHLPGLFATGLSVIDNATYRLSWLLIYDMGTEHFSLFGFWLALFHVGQ
jgi:hypothetical protein